MINDFWRMIWQVDSSKIVMLTKLKENDKVNNINTFTLMIDKLNKDAKSISYLG